MPRPERRPDRLRILLVDAHPDEADMYRTGLELAGVDVATCASADVALARLERDRFDAVVSEIFLPNRSGPNLARAVRASADERASVALVALCSLPADECRDVLRAGFDAYCTKPCTPSELAALVRDAVDRRAPDA